MSKSVKKILTIIIPSYNMEKYLDKCLQSLIINPKLMSILEILIVNDGSTDSTSTIGHTYQQRYPGVFKCIDKKNGHYGSCINCGIKEASGKFIRTLDADDSFETENFALFIDFLKDCDADCIYSNYVTVDGNDNPIENISFPFLPAYSEFNVSELVKNKEERILHTVQSITYKTENLREINYKQTEGISYTDNEWVFLPMSTVRKVCVFPKTVYKYFIGRDGQSVDPKIVIKNFNQEILVTKSIVNLYEENKSNFSMDVFPYLNAWALHKVSMLYRYFLFIYPFRLKIKDLFSFDKFLKECSPELYTQSSEVLRGSSIKFLNFPFIKNFRKRYFLKFIMVFFIDKIRSIKRSSK